MDDSHIFEVINPATQEDVAAFVYDVMGTIEQVYEEIETVTTTEGL